MPRGKRKNEDGYHRGASLRVAAREWKEYAEELKQKLRDGQLQYDSLLFNAPITCMDSVILHLDMMCKEKK